METILPILLILFCETVMAAKPTLKVETSGNRIYVKVVANVPWTLESSRDLTAWNRVAGGQPKRFQIYRAKFLASDHVFFRLVSQ